jgi:hypothetical protein
MPWGSWINELPTGFFLTVHVTLRPRSILWSGPSSTLTVCVKLSLFVQVTDVPALIVITPGSKR